MRLACMALFLYSNYTASDGALTPTSLSIRPQAFTTDFRVHWAQHPLRPEFAESTYFLYKVIYQGFMTYCRGSQAFQCHRTEENIYFYELLW